MRAGGAGSLIRVSRRRRAAIESESRPAEEGVEERTEQRIVQSRGVDDWRAKMMWWRRATRTRSSEKSDQRESVVRVQRSAA